MDPILVTLLAFCAVILLMLLRIPIPFALLAGASAGLFLVFAWPEGGSFDPQRGIRPMLSALADVPFSFAHSYELATIPLYIALGNIAHAAGITTDLFYAMEKLLRRLRGGIAMASILGCGGFSAISGSSVVCAATMGRIATPEMLNRNYAPGLATGVVAAGGTLGALIPPSIPFILFAILAEESVAKLLLAGIVPGVLTLLAYLFVVWLWVRFRPADAPLVEEADDGESNFRIYLGLWPTFLLLGIIIGGLFFGFFTGIQAAAVAVVTALVVGMIRRRMSWAALKSAMGDAALQSAVIFSIGIGAKLMITLVAVANLAGGISEWLDAAQIQPWAVIAAIVLILLVMGMFLDPTGIILLMVPITLPIVEDLGFHVIWYAVIFVKLIEIGLITPPIGLNAFVLKSVLPDTSDITLGTIFKGITVFIIIDLVVLGTLLFFPDLSLMIPDMM